MMDRASPPLIPRALRLCRGCVLLLALVLALPAWALDPGTRFGDYLLERWTAEDGLPQITVLTLAQDDAGYLWVGTQNGITRFDGRRFHVFNRGNTGLDLSMPVDSLAAADGAIWFATARGLLRQREGRFEEVPVANGPLSVRALVEWQGGLWAATVDGLRAPAHSEPAHLPGESLHALAIDSTAALWAGGESALWRLQGGEARRFDLPEPELRALALAPWQGRIAVGTRRGVWLLDPLSGAFERILPDLAEDTVATLTADRNGNLWAASIERLRRLRPDGSEERVEPLDLMERPWLHVIFEDRDGDLWLGSQRESLIRISDSALRVASRRQGLRDPLLWALLDDGADGLWVGSNGGLEHWRAEDGFRFIAGAEQLPDASVYSLHRDADGRVWLGTRGGLAWLQPGPDAARPARGARVVAEPALSALQGLQVTSFAESEHALWIGTLEGLWRWRQGELQRVDAHPGTPEARIRSLLALPEEGLLIGTEGGMRSLERGIWRQPDWADPLDRAFISSIGVLGGDGLLLTTLDKGLALYRRGELRFFDRSHGLPSDNAWTFDLVGRHVYVSTNDGAYRLPLARLLEPDPALGLEPEVVIRAVNRARGEQRMGCCNGGGHARSARLGSRLHYPTTNGLIELDTRRVREAPAAPGLRVERAETGAGSIDFPAALRLQDGQRDLRLALAGISLRHAAEVEFRYRLRGYSLDWTSPIDQTAVFTGLPPGRYSFELQGRFPGRDWHPAPLLPVEVVPRWAERRDLQLVALAAVLLLFALAWRTTLQVAARRRAALEASVRERTEALARANDRLRGANAALLEESRTDALTGAPNRRAALHLLSEWPSYALLLVDLDHFKALNDRHGHAAGDQALVQVAALLRQRLPVGARFARWGGEEFLLLLPGFDLSAALDEAEQLRAALAALEVDTLGGQRLRLSASIGVSLHPALSQLADDWQLSLELADRALYRAKALGRNQVVGLKLELKPGDPLPEALRGADFERLLGEGRLRQLTPRLRRGS